MEKKIIVLSCMHGRHNTVKHCLEYMSSLPVVMIYSDDADGEFLDQFENVIGKAQVRNKPLSYKWNTAVKCLAQVDFDAVVLLGSDDYVDPAFIEFVEENMNDLDMIGFSDIFFQEGNDFYYWEGYKNHRKGEPVGAGKTYSKRYLESIGYNLFPEFNDVGLDGISWRVVKRSQAKVKIFSLLEEGLLMVDVKDDGSMNSLSKLQRLSHLQRVKIEH